MTIIQQGKKKIEAFTVKSDVASNGWSVVRQTFWRRISHESITEGCVVVVTTVSNFGLVSASVRAVNAGSIDIVMSLEGSDEWIFSDMHVMVVYE